MYNRSMDCGVKNLRQQMRPVQPKNRTIISSKSPNKGNKIANGHNMLKTNKSKQKYDISPYSNHKMKTRMQFQQMNMKKGQFPYKKRIYEDEMKQSQQRIINPNNISIISQDCKINYYDGDSMDLGRQYNNNINMNNEIKRHPFSSFDLNKYKIKSVSTINSPNTNNNQSTKNTHSPSPNINHLNERNNTPGHQNQLSIPMESRNIQQQQVNNTATPQANPYTFSNNGPMTHPNTSPINPTLMNMMTTYSLPPANNERTKANSFNDIIEKFIPEVKDNKNQPINIQMMPQMQLETNQLFKQQNHQMIIKPNYSYRNKPLHEQSTRRMLIEYVKLGIAPTNPEKAEAILSQMNISNQVMEQDRIYPNPSNRNRFFSNALPINNEVNQTKIGSVPSFFSQLNNLFEESQEKINLFNFLIIPRVLNLICNDGTSIPCIFIVAPSELSVTHGIETYKLKYKELQELSSGCVEGAFDISDIDECSPHMISSFRFTIHLNKEEDEEEIIISERMTKRQGNHYTIEAPSVELRNAYVKGLNVLMKKLQSLFS